MTLPVPLGILSQPHFARADSPDGGIISAEEGLVAAGQLLGARRVPAELRRPLADGGKPSKCSSKETTPPRGSSEPLENAAALPSIG